ncbi:MAG TPA: outer membrane beta-barrel protein [Gemmatimonadales bacterium]|nr:outer membrane beta-barrel protein [Gemmatimonadales bacterium]
MRRIILGLTAVCWTSVLSGQAGTHFGLGVGPTFPVGEYHADQVGDGFNVGWQGMAFLEFAPVRSVSPFAIRLEGLYGENTANQALRDDLSFANGFPVDATMRLVGGSLDVRFHSRRGRRRGAGYLIGGIGIMSATFHVSGAGQTNDSSETNFTWNAGVGVSFPGRVGLFIEARYMHVGDIQGVGTNYVPVMLGVRF